MKKLIKKWLVVGGALVSSVVLHSCGAGMDYVQSAPAMEVASPCYDRGSVKSFKSQKRTVVKSGSMDMNVEDIGVAAKGIESMLKKRGGYVTSMSERKDESQRAWYRLRVPSAELGSAMKDLSALGVVTYDHISVKDVTEQRVKYLARLKQLKARKARLVRMKATKVADKLEIEKLIAELEMEIFELEMAAQEQAKHAAYSKLSVDLSRKSIKGPVASVMGGASWMIKKLFVIRE